MKRYIPIVASLMVFSLISCDEVMDLTQPEKAEVTYSNITLSLYQTGKYDLYLDEPEYQYNIMVEKSHCEKEAKAELAVVDAKEFGEEYHLLPVEYYDLDGSNFNFKGDDVLRMVNLRFHDLGTLDGLFIITSSPFMRMENLLRIWYLISTGIRKRIRSGYL